MRPSYLLKRVVNLEDPKRGLYTTNERHDASLTFALLLLTKLPRPPRWYGPPYYHVSLVLDVRRGAPAEVDVPAHPGHPGGVLEREDGVPRQLVRIFACRDEGTRRLSLSRT